MLPLSTIGFVKTAVKSPRYINIETLVKMIKPQKVIVVTVTVNLTFDKTRENYHRIWKKKCSIE